MGAGYYQRRADDYIRPAAQLVVDEVELPGGATPVYMRHVRGIPHHPGVLPAGQHGQLKRFELVAERFNPWDAQAVAVDLDGRRAGYVPAGDAAWVHDLVLAANRAGMAVWTGGRMAPTALDEDGEPVVRADVFLPTLQAVVTLADQLGLFAVLDRLLDAVGTETTDQLMDLAWEYDLPASLVKTVTGHAPQFPDLTWPTHPLPCPGRKPVLRLPGVLPVLLRERVVQARQVERQRKQAEQQIRLQAQAAAREQARQAADAVVEVRRRRDERIVELAGQGWSYARIGREVGLSPGTVSRIVRREGGLAANPGYNDESHRQRRERIAQVAALAAAGRTRRQIAEVVGVSADTVKVMLRDARFYQDPSIYPERRALAEQARAARAAGVTHDDFIYGEPGTASARTQAWRDALHLADAPTVAW